MIGCARNVRDRFVFFVGGGPWRVFDGPVIYRNGRFVSLRIEIRRMWVTFDFILFTYVR